MNVRNFNFVFALRPVADGVSIKRYPLQFGRKKNSCLAMEDIYTFGKKRYEPAKPLEVSFTSTVQDVATVLAAIVKCSVIGLWILVKSLVFTFLPTPAKDIQNQVAMVRDVRRPRMRCRWFFFFFVFRFRAGDRWSERHRAFHLRWAGQAWMSRCGRRCGHRRGQGMLRTIVFARC